MRLLTHNMLKCHVKGCIKDNFPLRIEVDELVKEEAELNPDFIRHIIGKLDWAALVATAKSLDISVPESLPESPDDEALEGIHNVIIETHLKAGRLVCNGCGRVYPVSNGIPNMLLNEDEV
eukprot:Opistho-2@27699